MDLSNLVIMIPGFLLGLVLHELAHGYAAYLLGDNTAKYNGRLTLNPLAHLDPVGTLMIVISSMSGIGFGWAKPVPVTPVNFTRRFSMRKGMMLVALAGPVTNFVVAFIAVLCYYILQVLGVADPIIFGIVRGILMINLSLGIFNLLPIPPLDGSKILGGILPARYDAFFYKLEQYGTIILLLLLILGIFDAILGPVFRFFLMLFQTIAYWLVNLFI